MSAVRIRLSSCAKTFGDGTRALEPIDLDVSAGETVVLLGPSGCGKTTLLRIIAGLEAPDAGGRVLFGEEDVTPIPIERRNVGMVFQSYALFPNLDVVGNIEYGLKVRKTPPAERAIRLKEMLAMMQLEELGHRRVDQLSGGQRQRVALARALAVQPRVLLLDEPLTALDAKLRDQLRVDIDRLLRSLEVTSIYVTHDQAEAMALGDRIAVMEKGRIAQVGTPQDVYYRPHSVFVADFVGTMNRLVGTYAEGHLIVPGGRLPWNHPAANEIAVMFRPEDVRIVNGSDAHLHGTVASAFFLGDHTRLVVETGASNPLVVETTERRTFKQGEPIALAVEPYRLMTLEAPR
jgi:putative spermidine/putrescine transport system ATP-binding protein